MVEVTNKTKRIANGVVARVIRDTVSENGTPVEITDDWYAQDSAGNIWYLGEYVTNYDRTARSSTTAGPSRPASTEPRPGSPCRRIPSPGMSYRQEYYKGEAEDKGAVITVGEEQVQVPFGHFDKNVLMTRDLVPDGAEGPGAEVLRPWRRPPAERAHGRRRRPRGAGQLHAGQLADAIRAATGSRRGPADAPALVVSG